MDPLQKSWSNRKGSSPARQSTWSANAESPTQEALLLPQLGCHPRLLDLPLHQAPPLQACPLQGPQLDTEQGEAHPLHPLSL